MNLGRVGGTAVVVLQLWQPHAALASPPLPSVDTLSPGVGLLTYDATLTNANTCTAGFLVRDKKGRPGILSASHCDGGGAIAIKLSGTDYTRIGTPDANLRRGDLEFVSLLPGVPTSPSISGVEPVKGVTDHVTKGDVLCKVGSVSGRQCGPVTAITADTVTFAAITQCGDSGGPVFAVNADGSVTAVGITSGGTMGEGTVAPPCGTPYPSAIAQLIQPMLRASAMTVLTS